MRTKEMNDTTGYIYRKPVKTLLGKQPWNPCNCCYCFVQQSAFALLLHESDSDCFPRSGLRARFAGI